jgi:electron transfer flavoprotein alpha subunit
VLRPAKGKTADATETVAPSTTEGAPVAATVATPSDGTITADAVVVNVVPAKAEAQSLRMMMMMIIATIIIKNQKNINVYFYHYIQIIILTKEAL